MQLCQNFFILDILIVVYCNIRNTIRSKITQIVAK